MDSHLAKLLPAKTHISVNARVSSSSCVAVLLVPNPVGSLISWSTSCLELIARALPGARVKNSPCRTAWLPIPREVTLGRWECASPKGSQSWRSSQLPIRLCYINKWGWDHLEHEKYWILENLMLSNFHLVEGWKASWLKCNYSLRVSEVYYGFLHGWTSHFSTQSPSKKENQAIMQSKRRWSWPTDPLALWWYAFFWDPFFPFCDFFPPKPLT